MKQKVVLLQTDLVDSTSLNERLGDEANGVVRATHDRVARDLLTQWDGQELERSDGFLMRFPTVDAAVGYTTAYHRALGALSPPLHARAGIHVGLLEFRYNSESHVQLGAKDIEAAGLSIPVTVRIMALATGGQTLLSPAARNGLGDATWRVVSHGHWRLKGMEDPLELFEVGGPNAPFAAPPDGPKAFRVVWKHDHWLPRRDVPHTLPAERNSFVGRRATLLEIGERMAANARLVTLLGTGGAGKTRIAQHFGWAHLGHYAGGVWFCDLSNARTLDGLCSAVAQGLGLALGDADPIDQIGAAIAGRGACLVVFDNFEQIVPLAPESIGRWLDRAIDATFLVTSRSTLGLDGEHVLAVAPLDENEGSELFLQRATAGGRDLEQARGEEGLVRTLIGLLDGLPLAIELAAARARVLDMRTLVARMRDRFKLLTSDKGRPSRQATLRTTFDWSWDLLDDDERRILAQLSVFEGGFDLVAVEAVCLVAGGDRTPDAVDVLQSLLDQSWIRRPSASRFALLKSVQEYAAERLRADPGTCRAAETRHGDYYASLDHRAAVAGPGVEVDNLIAATRRAIAARTPSRAAAALERSWLVLELRGPYRTASTLAEEALSLEGLTDRDRATVLRVAGEAAHSSGDIAAALGYFEAGLALARASGSEAHEARLLCGVGEVLTDASRHDEARAALDAALAMTDGLRDESSRCAVFKALGNLRQSVGDPAGAQAWYERALKIAQSLQDLRLEGGLFGNLGGMHHLQGHVATAQRFYDLAIARAESLGDKRWENNARCNLGLLLGESGDGANARRELERASAIAREIGHPRLECVAACNLGVVCADSGDTDASRRYYERALALARDLQDLRLDGQTRGHLGLLLARAGEPHAARAHFEAGEAILAKVTDDLSLGAILCQHAEAERLLGEPAAAIACHDAACAIADRLDVEADSPLRRSLDNLALRLDGHAERVDAVALAASQRKTDRSGDATADP